MGSKFLYTDKILDSIAMGVKDQVYLHVYEGAIRSGKTATVIQETFEAIQNSTEVLHLIAAQDLDAIRENLLNSEVGFLTLYPEYCKLKRDEIGSYYVSVRCDLPGRPSDKRILLASYADASKWKKILGKTLGVILVDEVNIAMKQFIDECFARQVSVDAPKMFWTLNGDVPSHWIYTDYINRCKIIGKVPLSIKNDMDAFKKKKRWFYTHWTMWDNPIMNAEKIENACDIFPVGSYYYKIKILGERGTPGKLIYNEYMSISKHIVDMKEKIFSKYVVGVDIGGNGATNCISLVGFENNFTRIGVIDKVQFKQCGYDQKKRIIIETITAWRNQLKYIYAVSVDCAESNFIADLKAAFKPLGIDVIGSYKATIKERIDMGIVLLSSGRLVFNANAGGREAYEYFLQAVWEDGKEGIERQDKNLPMNDCIDSIEYALTVFMRSILSAIYKGV